MKTVEIHIDPSGKVTATAHGFTGPACQVAVDGLLRFLGKEAEESSATAEFYVSEQQEEAVKW